MPRQETGSWLARHFTAAALCPQHAADVGLEASLVASELAKDVLYRGRSPVTLSVECWGSSVMISLRDVVPPDLELAPQRRRLTALMLDRLAEGWGEDVDAAGVRTLWCRLPSSPAGADHAFAGAAPLRHSA